MFKYIYFASDRLLLFVLYKLMRNPILFCSVAQFSMLCQRSEISASHQSCVVYPLSFFTQWWGDRSAMITMVRCTCHIPQVATLESSSLLLQCCLLWLCVLREFYIAMWQQSVFFENKSQKGLKVIAWRKMRSSSSMILEYQTRFLRNFLNK